MRRLPLALHSHSPAAKLLWLHIHANPGEHSARSLVADLGGSSGTWARCLVDLIHAGLIQEQVPSSGARPGRYIALKEPIKL
jgi:hypothetical protein